jgi:hypothetical protein
MLSFKLALTYAPKSKSWNFDCPLIGTHQDIIVNLNQETVGNGVLYDPSAKQSNSHVTTLPKSANFSPDSILGNKRWSAPQRAGFGPWMYEDPEHVSTSGVRQRPTYQTLSIKHKNGVSQIP